MRFVLILLVFLFILPLTSCDKIATSLRLIKADTAYNQAQFDKSIEIYKEVLENHPDDAQIHWKLGISYYSKGDLESVKKQVVRLRKLGAEELAQDLEHLLETPE